MKVRELVLHFYLKLIIEKWRNPYDLPKLSKKTWKWQHKRKAWVIFFKHLLWLALLSYENKYSSLLENKGEVYNTKDWHLLDIACRFHQTLVYFLALFGIISNLREKTLKVKKQEIHPSVELSCYYLYFNRTLVIVALKSKCTI